jgi:hypothetical protein
VTSRPKVPHDLFGAPIRNTPDRNREGRIQIAIVSYVRTVAPHIRILHFANGGWRDKAEAARFKALGVTPGATDLILALPNGLCAWWEIKAPKQGRLSDDQKAFLDDLERLGHRCAIIRSVDDARAELERLGVQTREASSWR